MFKPNLEIQNKVKELLNDPDTVDWVATISSESAKINYQLVFRKNIESNNFSSWKR